MARDDIEAGPLRELLAEVDGLRVQLVSVGDGQRVPWHQHTAVTDTIVVVVGSVVVEMTDPPARHELAPGDRLTIPAGRAHTVSGDGGAACRFLNVHAGGTYDFRPLGG